MVQCSRRNKIVARVKTRRTLGCTVESVDAPMVFALKAVGRHDELRLIGAANVPTTLNFSGFYATDVTRKIKRAVRAPVTTGFTDRAVTENVLRIYPTPILSVAS